MVAFESTWIAKKKLGRSIQKGHDHIGDRYDLISDVCGRFCLSKVGKLSHMQSHYAIVPTNYKIALNTNNSSHICRKVCKSAGKHKRHTCIHKNKSNDNKMRF